MYPDARSLTGLMHLNGVGFPAGPIAALILGTALHVNGRAGRPTQGQAIFNCNYLPECSCHFLIFLPCVKKPQETASHYACQSCKEDQIHWKHALHVSCLQRCSAAPCQELCQIYAGRACKVLGGLDQLMA